MATDAGSWLSVVPALLAIAAALALRRVVWSLLGGVVLGALLVESYDPLSTIVRLVGLPDQGGYLLGAITGSGHPWILGFAVLLGGLVRVLNESGGAVGLARQVTRVATTRRRGQLTAWGLGVGFFFDDYANTLFVGSSMGPVTDRLRISREKLAFIVDATAAPVASLAPISTWIVVELGYIGDELARAGIEGDAYLVFLQSIPIRFYPLFMLLLGFMVAWTGFDYGPMARAEARSRAAEPPAAEPQEVVDTDGAVISLALLPLGLVLLLVTGGIYFTGRAAALEEGLSLTPMNILANASSSKAMVLASLGGGLAAIAAAARRGRFTVMQGLKIWWEGGLKMAQVIAILVLAWSLGSVCHDLGTANFLVGLLGDGFEAGLLPTIVFLVSALVSFGTGTSWGTMGILFPLAVPLAHKLAPGNEDVLLGTISAILAGSVFGDHCSPISDTTIMSALATGCDQIAHVRTQLPYAVLAAVIAVLFGTLPMGLGLWDAWVSLLAGGVVLYAALRLLSTLERARSAQPASGQGGQAA